MSWKKVKLGDVCRIEKGTTGILKAIPGVYPMVVTSEERKSHNEFQFDDDAVIVPLVSGTGHGHASIKRIHFQKGKFALGSILCAIIPIDKTKLNAEYLYRFLDLNRENELVARMKGMANVSLPLKEIAQVEIPLPALKEQIEFVEQYENLEDKSDLLVIELTHQLTLVKKLRQQLLQDAVQGKLVKQNPKDEPASELLKKIKAEKEKLITEKKIKKQKELPPIKPEEIPFDIPENWVWCRLGEIGKITGGGTPSMGNDEYWNGDIPWVSPKDMWTEFVSDTEMKVTQKGIKESSANLIPKGSLLIVGRSGILKRKLPVAINIVECTVNQDMKVIIPYILQMNRFIQFVLRGLEANVLREFVKFGMTVHSLKYDEFSQMPIPVPPLSEQNRIVQKLDELMQSCNNLEVSIQQSAAQNEKLLQQVLREALRK
jgi:type I restriction enzyme S subunit